LISLNALGKARVWNPSDGKLLKEFDAQEGEGRALVYSPDGSKLFTAGQDRAIRVFDTHTWKELFSRTEAHLRSIYALALSRDGSLLLSGARDDGGIRVWNASDLSLRQEIESPLGVYGIGFSTNEREILTIHKQQQISRWNAADGRLLEQKRLSDGDSGLHALTVVPELSIAFAGSGGAWILRYNMEPPHRKVAAFSVPTGVYSLSWSATSNGLLAGGNDGIISQFQFDDKSSGNFRSGWRGGHDREISGIAWLPDGQHFATVSRDGSIACWNASDVPCDVARYVVTGRGKINSLALGANGEFRLEIDESAPRHMISPEAVRLMLSKLAK